MKLTNKVVVLDCLALIDALEQHRRNVSAALSHCWRLLPPGSSKGPAATDLVEALWHHELEIWRKVAMWGLTLDDADRERIKAAVAAMFKNEDVPGYLSRNGTNFSSYMTADAEEFRAMAAKAFAPKEQS